MIPSAHITEWRAFAPWSRDAWIEQDLIISRALVEMFAVPELAADLAFRGGTALYKLYLNPVSSVTPISLRNRDGCHITIRPGKMD